MAKRIITETQWQTLETKVKDRIFVILDACDVLIKHLEKQPTDNNVLLICAALYTHALEEYGKLLLLQKCEPISGKIEIEYDNQYKKHTYKFELALQDEALPQTCKTLYEEGSYASETYSPDTYDTDTPANWETRLKILNTDFDDNGNVIEPYSIDLKLLVKAISDFRNHMNKYMI